MIAGGAVRDLTLKREIKDIDIFIDGTPNNSIIKSKAFNSSHWIHNLQDYWKMVLEDHNWSAIEVRNAYRPQDVNLDIIIRMYNLEYDMPFLGNQYQFVPHIDAIFLLKPAMNYFYDNFDFNICKAAFTGKKFIYTGDFLKDAKNKTITLSGSKNIGSVKYSLNSHLPRLKEKYPDYKLVIPPEYKEVYYKC